MASDYYSSKGWKTFWALYIVVPILLAVTFLVDGTAWWRVALAAALVATSLSYSIVFRRAMGGPLVSITADDLCVWSLGQREATRIPRAEIRAVAWSNPGAICLHLNSGVLQAVSLTGLSRRDKDALLAEFRSWLGDA